MNEYYKVVLSLSWKEYRKKSGTPYLFCIEDGNPIKIENPYKEVVELTYRKQASPSQSTSIAHLLEEVGINLYTSKKRMFFELLQNADDASAKAGVNMKVQICNGFFVVTHNGYAFNRSDFYSITSAAQAYILRVEVLHSRLIRPIPNTKILRLSILKQMERLHLRNRVSF